MQGIFDWRSFLADWQREILPLIEQVEADEEPCYESLSYQALRRKSLAFDGALDQQIMALERRIGTSLPPSYISFLKATNGWLQVGMDAEDGKIWSTEEVQWFKHQDPQWIAAWEDAEYSDDIPSVPDELYFIYGEAQDSVYMRTEYLGTALAISEGIDSAIYLLNPKVISDDGEWEAWFFGNKLPGAYRYPSFKDLMEAEKLRIVSNLEKTIKFMQYR